LTDEELDAYENALCAERAVASGTGDEDDVDLWMGQANNTTKET
jgi:hypothetical protein